MQDRTTELVRISSELHRILKIKSAERGQSMSYLLNRLIEEELHD